MREQMTTWLDLLGLVLLAAGAAAGLHPLIGWAGLGASGVVILGGSAVAARPKRTRTKAGGEAQ